MIDVREYVDPRGRSQYRKWFDGLNSSTAAKVATALTRLAGGNFSNAKGIASGLFEYKVDFGPGYRIYFGQDGERLIILLGGGSRVRQRVDIAAAHLKWQEYKHRKKENPNAPHS
jgi:putative addiction module killer protein